MLTFIQPFDAIDSFPPLRKAETDPNGLLAIGGDLSSERLLSAYSQGIFPWFNQGQSILWWSPDPRMVLYPDKFHANRSLKKSIKKQHFYFSVDLAFNQVIQACAEPRSYSNDTWINVDMQKAYMNLHQLGYAHSLEIWLDNKLVGGLYGVALGRIFFGESMFSKVTDASKAAFWALSIRLVQLGFQLIDCQVYSKHLQTLGAREIPRDRFEELLQKFCDEKLQLIKPQDKTDLLKVISNY